MGAPWGPMGPLGAPWGPWGPNPNSFRVMGRCLRQTPPQKSDFWDFRGTLGPLGGGFPSPVTMGGVHFQKFHKNLHFLHLWSPKWWFLEPNPPRLGVSIFKNFTKISILAFFGSKMVKKGVIQVWLARGKHNPGMAASGGWFSKPGD